MLTLSLLILHGCGLDPVYFPSSSTDTGPGSETDADADADADGDSDSDTDSDSDADAPKITSVDPVFGTTFGGDRVTITGNKFDKNTKVKFGSKSADIINVSSATEMVVETPEQTGGGTMDVIVTNGNSSDTLNDGFTYFEDGTGKYGTFGEFTWNKFVGTGWANPTDAGAALLYQLPTPDATEYWELYAPQMESCRSEYTPNLTLTVMTATGINDMEMDRGSGSFTVPWVKKDAYTYWNILNLTASDWISTTNYTIRLPDIDPFPATEITKGVTTPASFSVSKPDFNGGSAVGKSSLTLVWSGGATGDYMVATIQLYDANAKNIVETVTCAFNDDGSFTVPAGTWSSWAAQRPLVVAISRIRVATGTIDYNHSISGMVGNFKVLGVAVTQ